MLARRDLNLSKVGIDDAQFSPCVSVGQEGSKDDENLAPPVGEECMLLSSTSVLGREGTVELGEDKRDNDITADSL